MKRWFIVPWAVWFRWVLSYVRPLIMWCARLTPLAGIFGWVYDQPVLWAFFVAGGWMYAWLIVLTFVFLMTFGFQISAMYPAGSFRYYLAHRNFRSYVEDLLNSVFWPFCWHGFDTELLKKQYGGFEEAFSRAVAFWFGYRWCTAYAPVETK